LSVTYSPDDSVYDDSLSHFESLGYLVDSMDEKVTLMLHPNGGLVRFETAPHFHKITLPGQVLSFLREIRGLDSALGLLSSRPHKVTRLDAAIDSSRDTPAVFKWLDRKFPDGYANLTRKKAKIEKLLSVRDSDGAYTGTYYFGSRGGAAKTFARVYDKQAETLQRRGKEIPPTTRYEVVVKEGASLRDAAIPAPIFWNYASPALLRRPSGVPEWVKSNFYSWSYDKPEALPVEVLKRLIERSGQLRRMTELADSIGGEGRNYLISLLSRHIEPTVKSISSKST
jgi:hypothetical protein